MSDIPKLLERQARWQKNRKKLSWAEKVRMAERVRADLLGGPSSWAGLPPVAGSPAAERPKAGVSISR
jgi:hypothetical protein